MSRTNHVRPPRNPEAARADAERRRSGAAGTHGDRRTKRLRTRSARKRQAIRDQE